MVVYNNFVDWRMRSTYHAIESYLKDIINSPSTINRIATHYNIGVDPNHPEKVYILFEEHVVLEFEFPLPPRGIVEKVLL